MIHELGVEIQAKLRERGCPFVVVDGPEPTQPATFGRERIVIEYNEDGKDLFEPTRSQHVNPKVRGTDRLAAKITIYAQSPKAGALYFEHRRRAHQVRRQVVVALGEVIAERKNAWKHEGGRFTRAADLAKSETPGGAVYELLWSFEASLPVLTWAGAGADEFTVTANNITSVTKVRLANVADDDDDPTTVPADAETACGP